MVEHLGHGKHGAVVNETGNARNGRSEKTLMGDFGKMTIDLPRDRQSRFEPQIITKHQTHWRGFDDKILSLYARSMTVLYGSSEVSSRSSSDNSGKVESNKAKSN